MVYTKLMASVINATWHYPDTVKIVSLALDVSLWIKGNGIFDQILTTKDNPHTVRVKKVILAINPKRRYSIESERAN